MTESGKEYKTYDFDSDDKWLKIMNNISFSGTKDEEAAALEKRRRKYFKAEIDEHFDILFDKKEEPPLSSSSYSPKAEEKTTPTPSPSTTSTPSPWRRRVVIALNYLRLLLHLSIVFSSTIYFVFMLFSTPISNTSYYISLLFSALQGLLHIPLSYGIPALSDYQSYLAKVSTDDMVHGCFSSMILYSRKPTTMAVLPVIVRSTMFVAFSARGLLQFPIFASSRHIVLSYLDQLTGLHPKAMGMVASWEVYAFISLLMSVVFEGTSVLFTLFLFFQFLRMRYMVSPYSQQCFREMKAKMDTVMYHPRCPALVTTGYRKVAELLHNSASAGRPSNSGGSSCNIQ